MSSSVGKTILKLIAALGVVLASFGVTLWILNNRGAPQEPNMIHVTEATYGLNCNGTTSNLGTINVVKPGNATADVAKTCDNQATCNYTVTARLGDPANGCGKDFTVNWQCSADHAAHQVALPGEAASKSATIACPAQ